MTEYKNNIQIDAENEINSSAEDSQPSEVGNVPDDSKNVPTFRRNRLEGKFSSKNVINLSRKNFSSAEISLL